MDSTITILGIDVATRALLVAALVAGGGTVLSVLIRMLASRILRRRIEHIEAAAEEAQRALAEQTARLAAADESEAERLAAEAIVIPTTGAATFGLRVVRAFLFPMLVIASFYGALSMVIPEGEALLWVNRISVALLSLFVVRFSVVGINEAFRQAAERQASGVKTRGIDIAKVRPLRSVTILLVWIAGIIFLLGNLGFDVTAVVAGLGIGGIAVALGAQALLGDLFSYFVILLDRPFAIGDFLIFDGILGTVEKIGVKSTRIRALSGQQISVSNSELTKARVNNYTRMETRRIVFKLQVVYGTPVEKLQEIPLIVKSTFDNEPTVRFDRAHFAAYGTYSLDFEVVYTMLTPDYNLYMDLQQRVYLRIYERFHEEGIEFAYPTQVVEFARDLPAGQTPIGFHGTNPDLKHEVDSERG